MADLYVLNAGCPSCRGENYIAMYELCTSDKTGEEYPGACGKICLDCGHFEENSGRMGFGWYTGKYCYGPEYYDISSRSRWDPDAAALLRKMKKYDGDLDMHYELQQLAAARNRRAQQARQQQENDARRRQQQVEQEARERAAKERAQREWEENQRRIRLQEEAEQARLERERQRRAAAAERQRLADEAKAQAQLDNNRKLARNAFNNGNWADAYKYYYAVKQQKNELFDYENNFFLAWCLYKNGSDGDVQAGLKYINEYFKNIAVVNSVGERKSTDELWNYQNALECRARLNVKAGNLNEACTDFFELGNIYYEKDDFVKADKWFTEGLEKTGMVNEYEDFFRMAYARSNARPSESGTDEYCINYYRAHIEKCPSSFNQQWATANLGYHLNRLGRYKETVNDLSYRINRRLPVNETHLAHLADAYYELKDWQNAKEMYLRLNREYNSTNAFRLGYSFLKLEEYDESEKWFNKSIEDNKDKSACYWNLGWIYRNEKNDSAEACDYYLLCIMNASQDYIAKNKDTFAKWIEYAENTKNNYLAEEMLKYLPEEKARRDAEKKAAEAARQAEEERKRKEAEAARKAEEARIAAEKKAEEERIAAEQERMRKEAEAERLRLEAEEAARKAEEERRRLEEEARIAAEKKAAEEKRLLEEEMLLLL